MNATTVQQFVDKIFGMDDKSSNNFNTYVTNPLTNVLSEHDRTLRVSTVGLKMK